MKICVYGSGSVGLATASYLAMKDGVDVTIFERPPGDQEPRHRGCSIETLVDISSQVVPEGRASLQVTDDVQYALQHPDLVLVSVSAAGHQQVASNLGQYNTNNAPVVLFPGKFCSSYVFNRILNEGESSLDFEIGEVSTSIFYSIMHGLSRDRISRPSIANVEIANKKKNIAYANVNGRNQETLGLLNTLFGEDSFVDGTNPLCVGLQSYDSIINAVAIISAENGVNILSDRMDHSTDYPIYGGQSSFAANFLKIVSDEKIEIASSFGLSVKRFREWLMDVSDRNKKRMDLPTMLLQTYGGSTTSLRGVYEDRRLNEDVPFGLVPLEMVAKRRRVTTPRLTELINIANEVMLRGKRYKKSKGMNGRDKQQKSTLHDVRDFRDISYSFEELGIDIDSVNPSA